MKNDLFRDFSLSENNAKWDTAINRCHGIYEKENEIRTPFERDYTRLLHCTAYRRLKHKTQVFFATTNDHVCTRIEHVNHVNSVSKTISRFLGLNSDLSDSISIGHDLGHAPFGHEGETVLKQIITKKYDGETFWHEKNSLRYVDHIETLEGPDGKHHKLNLTYAVRDGIVCHCGEVDENGLRPREESINLDDIRSANSIQPYTWEGCVVKISDKIAYLGRDIEDAITLKILDDEQLARIDDILRSHEINVSIRINTTVLMHTFITDLCKNSTPELGLRLSESAFRMMKEVKDFCKVNIYQNRKIERYKKFVKHLITELFFVTNSIAHDIANDRDTTKRDCPSLFNDFSEYLKKYSNIAGRTASHSNIPYLYDIHNERDLFYSCIDFISGMTDQYAIKKFKETITF